MYDIQELETNWKKYKQKRRSPWYLGTLSIIVLAILVNIFLQDNQYLNLIKNFKIPNIINKIYTPKDNINFIKEKSLLSLEVGKSSSSINNIPIEKTKEENKVKTKININISKTSTLQAYTDVENRFKISHDVDDALFLAKSYYKKGLYKKALYWSLETNKIDGNIEDSIFIFIKSKIKLGNKTEGITILNAYIKKTSSNEARKLLFNINNGAI